ncbi:unnamed protein product [Meganyctiphanes norvegica]|uniref:Secreted protein n=1 Tax=Meganyctiphanes norvegica TaxID=48144 RepID=A0AAV2R7N4_MEGNR
MRQPKRSHVSKHQSKIINLVKLQTSKMVCFRFFVILMVAAVMMPSLSNSAPVAMPDPGLFDLIFPRAMARARANDRGANSFAGFGNGRRIGGSAINPDPFAFPGQSPFPAVPLFI